MRRRRRLATELRVQAAVDEDKGVNALFLATTMQNVMTLGMAVTWANRRSKVALAEKINAILQARVAFVVVSVAVAVVVVVVVLAALEDVLRRSGPSRTLQPLQRPTAPPLLSRELQPADQQCPLRQLQHLRPQP